MTKDQNGKKMHSQIFPDRFTAHQILSAFFFSTRTHLDTILHRILAQNAEIPHTDRNLITELSYGVIRWKRTLDSLLSQYYKPKAQSSEFRSLHILLQLGAYQLLYLSTIPAYAAIDTTVEIAKQMLPQPLVKLCNGVLRQIDRDFTPETFHRWRMEQPLGIRWSFPDWMIHHLAMQYPDPQELEMLLAKFNERPWFGIRCNLLAISREELFNWLTKRGEEFREWVYDPRFFTVRRVHELQNTQAYQHGWFTIQDPSAGAVVLLTAPSASMRILDCCAAPGGKTSFIAELTEEKAVIHALDVSKTKISILESNLSRYGYQSIQLHLCPIEHFRSPHNYDCVLLDAPCSAIGTIRKHPDIKWRLKPEALPKLQKRQRRMLAKAASLVRSGGILVYSTCTLLEIENQSNIQWFLTNFPGFRIEPAETFLPAPLCSSGFLLAQPHKLDCDGAFAVRLRKIR